MVISLPGYGLIPRATQYEFSMDSDHPIPATTELSILTEVGAQSRVSGKINSPTAPSGKYIQGIIPVVFLTSMIGLS